MYVDADEDAISVVASALKKLDGIGKDLHAFKDMVAVQEAENVIRKKLETLDIHIAPTIYLQKVNYIYWTPIHLVLPL